MMKYSSRAFACLIFYLFLGFHVATWAGGDERSSDRFKVGMDAQFECAPTQACLENQVSAQAVVFAQASGELPDGD